MPVILPAIRRRRRHHQHGKKLATFLVGAVLSGSIGYQFFKAGPTRSGPSSTDQQQSTILVERPPRKVYLYSVIPGGVDSAEELATRLNANPVAARHYADFKVDRAVLVYARFDQQKAYVSYRKKDEIFWTRKRVHVDNSEILLTDGKGFARTRCGNRLSETPQKPTQATEPAEEALLYVPTFTSDRLIRLPADWEDAPPLPVRSAFVLPAPGAILPFEEIVRPLRFVPLAVGASNNFPALVGNSPEPSTIILFASGCLTVIIFKFGVRQG